MNEGTTISAMIIVVIVAFSAPVLVYHFLIAPNVIGVITAMTPEGQSQQLDHYSYWLGFWIFVPASGGILSILGKRS